MVTLLGNIPDEIEGSFYSGGPDGTREIVVELVPFTLTSVVVIVAFVHTFFIAGSNSEMCQDEVGEETKKSFLYTPNVTESNPIFCITRTNRPALTRTLRAI